MTINKRSFLSMAAAAAVLSLLSVGCARIRQAKAPSTEFATLIKAYTGGVISGKSTIRVELNTRMAEVQENVPVNEDYFIFFPSIKGTTRWISPTTLEFVPEQGALRPGQTYKGVLRLDKIMKLQVRRLKRFPFSFMVAPKEAALTADEIIIRETAPGLVSVKGEIALSEALPIEDVKAMADFDFPGDSAAIDVSPGQDSEHFRYEISGLTRGDSPKKLSVSLKNGVSGFKTKSSVKVTIPPKGVFSVIDASLVEGKDPFVRIQFSEPLSETADYSGLVTLENVGNFFLDIKDNIVKAYFEGKDDESSVVVTVSEGLKSLDGQSLPGDYSASFESKSIPPAVTIPMQGNILPDTKRLVLPFRAVNLKAVDLRVIKIYEDNILMFLQDNDLSGGDALRRSGKLVYKRCIRLDSDPSKNLHKWQDFAVDLSGLFRQEEGAIYRIRLSFKQEYSIYGKDEGMTSGSATDELVDLSSGDMTEKEVAVWDTPNPYYYDDGEDTDWSRFNWKDVDNPLTPSYYMESERFPERNLMTSDIGLIAKYSGTDKIWVSASDIISGKPMYGVDFEVYDYQLKKIGSGKADSDGLDEITLSGKPFALVARRNSSVSYLRIVEGEENNLSRFDVGGKLMEKGMKGFVYGERGVWRPGDTLHVTMILMDKLHSVPDTHPAVLELYTPQGQFYCKQVCTKAENGFYTYDVPTLRDDPTGLWNAYFKVGGATFHKSLQIESIKPNRLKINLDMGAKILRAKENATETVTSSWLTGPPAANLKVRTTMTLSPGGTFFKGFEGYDFYNPASEFTTKEIDLSPSRLDKDGKSVSSVKMPSAENAPGMLKADIVCSVEEPGGGESFTTATLPFSPFDAYVGIKFPKTDGSQYIETDTDQSFPVAVVDVNGKRVSGHTIEWRIYKMEWSWWWEAKASELSSYVNGTGAEAVSSGTAVSSDRDLQIPFRINYPDWGRYFVYVKDVTGGHSAGGTVFADWPSYRGMSEKKDPSALSMLTFSTDKKTYTVGETATVYIPGAADGKALVSIENSTKVISRKWVSTKSGAGAKHTFKITPEMAPDVYVHISLIQPHSHPTNDLPIRLYGVQRIEVENEGTRLEPVITVKDEVRPEEKFSVKVSEKKGRPMTYTLAIVDEGLLDLTAFKTPDPWKEMYSVEALGVKTWDLYDRIIASYGGVMSPMFSVGGDTEIKLSARKDNRFNPVVKFLGPFTLKSGAKEHRIKLPMYIGSLRVMVVAGGGGAFGNAEKTISVKSPLMVLPTLPRTVGVGEKVTIPVNVFAMEKGVKDVKVSISAEGPVTINGMRETSLKFGSPGDKLVRFSISAAQKGAARITVTASSESHMASETISVEVRNPNPPQTALFDSPVGKGKTVAIRYSPSGGETPDSAVVSLTGFPSVNFDKVFNFVENYAYTCTEQLSSKGLSLLYGAPLMSEGNSLKAKSIIPSIIQEIYSRQLPDGGFCLWSGESSSNEWVSSMAGQFLTEALNQGYDVSKGVLGSWKRYQGKCVQNYRRSESRFLSDLVQAYRLYTLALSGDADNGSMNRLKESGNLSPQARWMLSCAYSTCGKKSIAQELLKGGETAFDNYSSGGATFASPLRDKSIALEALVLADDIPEALALASEVAKGFSEGGVSTQETAFASAALSSLSKKTNTGFISAEISQNSDTKEIKSVASTLSYVLKPETGTVSIKNNSDGDIYASVLTVSSPADGAKAKASSSGLKISVSYLAEDGTPMEVSKVKQGTDFTAVIKVASTSLASDYEGLALTHMIPSGWEIENDRMLGRPETVPEQDSFTYKDIRDDRTVWYFNLDRGAVKTFKARLHASYEGEFVLPATKCEAMYDARIFASTPSGKTEVVR